MSRWQCVQAAELILNHECVTHRH